MKYRTHITAKAEVIKPNSQEFKAVASSLKDRYGFDLKPQMDLMYVRSCLMSAGSSVGINDNDDIFTREETWASRHSPILKPFNWQHDDKDIVGVMYTVQARSLDGTLLDINEEKVPDCDFDLWVEAAIFRLIHEDRAAEIEARSKAGTLYVSMEAWFDDYSYGFCKSENKQPSLEKIVARNADTSFLDRHLRCGGGAGMYRDPESNQDVRIGRVLRSITFGGCGFVDRPANKRSIIEAAEPMNSLAEREIELQIEKLLKKVLESQGDLKLMTTQANIQANGPDEIAAAVDSALTKRETAAAAVRERELLQARASEVETENKDLQTKVAELTQVKTAKEAELVALQSQLAEYGEAVNQLVQAGATAGTPAEIAAIDGAKDGAGAFAAKIAWITKSVASLQVRAARATELESQLAQAEAVVREQDVRSLLGEVISEEVLEMFVTHAATLDNDEYTRWRDEKELMVIELSTAAAAKEKKLPPFMKGKEKKGEEKATCANMFEAILAKRRSESGKANPGTPLDMGHLINHPGTGDGVNSGVNSGTLKTPRHKIAGSAEVDPAKSLENAQAESGVVLAGSTTGDEGEVVSPFRTLAGLVTHHVKEEGTNQAKKPGFDPVQ